MHMLTTHLKIQEPIELIPIPLGKKTKEHSHEQGELCEKIAENAPTQI